MIKKTKTKAESQTPVVTRSPAQSAADTRAINKFKKLYADSHARLCFLLDDIPPRDSVAGLEMSSFRRIALFEEMLGIKHLMILTHSFQNHGLQRILDHIEVGRFDSVSVLNLYDYLQEINRAAPPVTAPEPKLNQLWHAHPAQNPTDTAVDDEQGHCVMYIHRYANGKGIDFINYLEHDRLYRRDTYDIQGFLSRSEFIKPGTNFGYANVFYRPDGTVALTTTCVESQKEKNVAIVDGAEIMDRWGRVTHHFTDPSYLVSWWLRQVLADRSFNYLVLGDAPDKWQQAFRDLKTYEADFPHVKTLAVSHNNHTMDPADPYSKLGDNFQFLCDQTQKMDAVVSLTEWQKLDVEKRYGKDAHPLTVIPHSMPDLKPVPKDFKPILPPHSLVLAARFSAQKGHKEAVIAFQELVKTVPDASLHFYGFGTEVKTVRAQIKEAGLEDKIIIHPFTSDIGSVYASAALLLSCSKFEGFGLTMQEALYFGCPVIAFNCRYGPSDIVINGYNGYLLPVGDTKGLAKCCIRLLTDEKLHKRFSENAVKSTERFAKKVIAARWARLFTDLLTNIAPGLDKTGDNPGDQNDHK
ncbi:MAG: glycosyltransferase [Succinivibrio sp.]|nr:glycosyltransferase [Succinivibrio sp.]